MLKALREKDFEKELSTVMTTYVGDFDKEKLKCQLKLLCSMTTIESISDIKTFIFMQSWTDGQKLLIPEVVLLTKFLIILPATNAISERAFSTLRRVKNYCRATTTQKRLNHLMLLSVYKDYNIDLIAAANEFVARKIVRKDVFGTFATRDFI